MKALLHSDPSADGIDLPQAIVNLQFVLLRQQRDLSHHRVVEGSYEGDQEELNAHARHLDDNPFVLKGKEEIDRSGYGRFQFRFATNDL